MAVRLTQLAARMRNGEQISLRETAATALALSMPAILEQMVVTAMQYIDSAMVGRLGAAATASIGIVSSSTWLLNGVLVGLYTSFSIQIAQYLGAGRERDARTALRQAMLFNLVMGLAAAALGIAISGQLPVWLGAGPALQADASAYFAIWAGALPVTMGLGLYSSILRSCGDTRTPSMLHVLACLLDVVFNFLLIMPTRPLTVAGRTFMVWGAGMGVAGAALGTALATGTAAAAMLAVLLLREGPLCIRRPGSWRFDKDSLRTLGRIGLPLAGERAALSSAQVILVRVVAALGTVSVAANSLAVNAEGLCYMPGYGVQAAAIALIGQAIGAGRKDMARRFALLCTALGAGMMAVTGLGLYAFAPWLMMIFTADAAVIALGAAVLRIEAFAEPLFGVSIVASGAMQGAGDTRACFALNMLSMWGVRVTLATLLAPRFGLAGVWAAMALELSFRGGIFLARLVRGKWLQKSAI